MLSTNAQIIGIHNQDPLILYVQFSVDERYYIYGRDRVTRSESVQEELFGKEVYNRIVLDHTEEQILFGKIMFHPKIKKAIQDYPYS